MITLIKKSKKIKKTQVAKTVRGRKPNVKQPIKRGRGRPPKNQHCNIVCTNEIIEINEDSVSD